MNSYPSVPGIADVAEEDVRTVSAQQSQRLRCRFGCYHVGLVLLEDPGREFASIRIAVNDENFDPAEASGHDRLRGITRRAMSVVAGVVGMQEAAGVEP